MFTKNIEKVAFHHATSPSDVSHSSKWLGIVTFLVFALALLGFGAFVRANHLDTMGLGFSVDNLRAYVDARNAYTPVLGVYQAPTAALYQGAFLWPFGLDLMGMKVANIVADLGTMTLLIVLGIQLTSNRWLSLVLAAIWATRPMAVYWSRVEMAHTCATFFVTLAVFAFVIHAQRTQHDGKPWPLGRLTLVGLGSALAAGGHPSLILIPGIICVLVAVHAFFVNHGGRRWYLPILWGATVGVIGVVFYLGAFLTVYDANRLLNMAGVKERVEKKQLTGVPSGLWGKMYEERRDQFGRAPTFFDRYYGYALRAPDAILRAPYWSYREAFGNYQESKTIPFLAAGAVIGLALGATQRTLRRKALLLSLLPILIALHVFVVAWIVPVYDPRESRYSMAVLPTLMLVLASAYHFGFVRIMRERWGTITSVAAGIIALVLLPPMMPADPNLTQGALTEQHNTFLVGMRSRYGVVVDAMDRMLIVPKKHPREMNGYFTYHPVLDGNLVELGDTFYGDAARNGESLAQHCLKSHIRFVLAHPTYLPHTESRAHEFDLLSRLLSTCKADPVAVLSASRYSATIYRIHPESQQPAQNPFTLQFPVRSWQCDQDWAGKKRHLLKEGRTFVSTAGSELAAVEVALPKDSMLWVSDNLDVGLGITTEGVVDLALREDAQPVALELRIGQLNKVPAEAAIKAQQIRLTPEISPQRLVVRVRGYDKPTPLYVGIVVLSKNASFLMGNQIEVRRTMKE